MKKLFVILMLMAATTTAMSQCFAYDAYGQAQQASDDGQTAVNSNSDEGSRYYSGQGFDTQSTSPPAVDLRGVDNPTPQLLRTSNDNDNPYIPRQYRSLHTNPPPSP